MNGMHIYRYLYSVLLYYYVHIFVCPKAINKNYIHPLCAAHIRIFFYLFSNTHWIRESGYTNYNDKHCGLLFLCIGGCIRKITLLHFKTHSSMRHKIRQLNIDESTVYIKLCQKYCWNSRLKWCSFRIVYCLSNSLIEYVR